jgi:dipeptidyl aminopeptidase/acylaminoacyl peptidase
MLLRSGFLLLILSTTVTAQTKRPLKHSDADAWRSINSPTLSRNGQFVAYALQPQEGDGEYVVRNLITSKEWRLPSGSTGTAVTGRAGAPRVTAGFAPRLAFTADSKLLILSVSPTKAELEKAKKDSKEAPKAGIAIVELAGGKITRLEGVRGWTLPEENSTYLAYTREPKPANPVTPPKEPREPMSQPVGPRSPRTTTPAKVYGTELTLRNLTDGSERTLPDVVEYSMTKDAKALVFTVSAKAEENNGVYLAVPGLASAAVPLLAGKGRYQRLTWDEKQDQLVFFADQDEKPSPTAPRYKLYYWERKSSAISFSLPPAPERSFTGLASLIAIQPPAALNAAKATELLSTETPGFKKGWLISDRSGLSFSRDGSRLVLSAAPAPPEPTTMPMSPTEQRIDLDLWHWKDDYIQPMQKIRAETERSRTYRAVLNIKEKKYLQLADETLPDVVLAADGALGLGVDERPYRQLVGREGTTNFADYFIVNTREGTRTPLVKKPAGGLMLSPEGRYALNFDGKDWQCFALATGKSVNLTGKLGVSFHNEEHDQPQKPGPNGLAGWTANDAAVLIYDRHDIWQINPDGSGAKNLTQGLGRKSDLRLRYLSLDARERFINLDKPLLLAAENLHTRDEGFYRLDIKNGPPRCLIMSARSFSTPVKAKNADVYLVTASTFNEEPNLIVSDPSFKELKKVSDANPQKKDLLWGQAELIHYRSSDGLPLQGILIKPENFEQGKKYPMVIYIYERLSQGLHRFSAPRPGTSINPTYYASNGYLVLMPDIAYTVGSPGPSAMKCVLPAISAVADMGILDEKAIGIQGHSWGGYQIAYMITQTNRFKAAIAGAPVSDMVSAYGGIRWGTGLSRQFQYEQSQSRIGGTLWQTPLRYLENSPIFMADRVHTPLMMLHNDQDDAVPWYQGIEYYMALRRLEKEVYLLNYNGEFHGLRKRVNQKDYTVRMQEFFDHHLKGAPKPAWMEKGIPYLDRVKNSPIVGGGTTPPATSSEEEQP